MGWIWRAASCFVCRCLSITVQHPACPSLTVSFSRLLQAFARAVREALHHAQEYAEALREPGELLRLRPPHRQHRGLLRRPGELPKPLHGEYSSTITCSASVECFCLLLFALLKVEEILCFSFFFLFLYFFLLCVEIWLSGRVFESRCR